MIAVAQWLRIWVFSTGSNTGKLFFDILNTPFTLW